MMIVTTISNPITSRNLIPDKTNHTIIILYSKIVYIKFKSNANIDAMQEEVDIQFPGDFRSE